MAASSRRGWLGLWLLAAALAVGAGVGMALWRAPKTVNLPLPASPGAEALPPMPAPPLLAQAAPVRSEDTAGAAGADQPPPGVSAHQWRALQAELSGQPQELQRLFAYFAFAHQLQRFRNQQALPAAERHALALALDRGLDQRLQRRELHAGEARAIKIAVIAVLVPGDEVQRQRALAAWQDAASAARAPPATGSVAAQPGAPSAAQFAARNAEFQRRQAAIVGAWSATAPGLRDHQALERQLDALRHSSFTPPR